MCSVHVAARTTDSHMCDWQFFGFSEAYDGHSPSTDPVELRSSMERRD